mmetsp:Transcript_32365/g.42826  ORF Transcript_32365/g.42826 Transcript_32365/m.42826 type:complete len:121 (-) Transcript_32365:489-851(-)
MKELIKEKVEGARKVLDALKLRSVLQVDKAGGGNHNYSQKSLHDRQAATESSNPYIKNQEFFQPQVPKYESQASDNKKVVRGRVLNVYVDDKNNKQAYQGGLSQNDTLPDFNPSAKTSLQ